MVRRNGYVSHIGAAFFVVLLSIVLATPSLWVAPQHAQAASRGATGLSIQAPESLPASYDARVQGYISPVRLQDPWGACWAFGALAAMEANLVKQGLIAKPTQLSPRHLIYFAGTPISSAVSKTQAGEGQYPIEALVSLYGENAVFEMGGHAQEVASAIASGEGVVFESEYPFKNNEGYLSADGKSYAAEGTWALDESARFASSFGLRNMHRLPNIATFSEQDNIDTYAIDYYALDAVKQAIYDYGAVSASYCSYHSENGQPNYYDAEHSSFFTNETTLVDHDICIIGWNDTYSRYNFTTGKNGSYPEQDGAWIVKNSWGANSNTFPNKNAWGEENEGYFYISYYDRSLQAFTAWEMMSLTSKDATRITNQYDYMGQRSNSQTRVIEGNPQAFANIFTAEQRQNLKAVSVNTYEPQTEVSICLYALDASWAGSDPTTGTLLEQKDVVCTWAGYHRIAFEKAHLAVAGQRFAVVVSMYEVDASGTKTAVASIEAGNNIEMVETYGLSHYDTVICNPGETAVYATLDDTLAWVDGVVYAQYLHNRANDGAFFGNACIKVFADPVEEPSLNPEPKSKQQAEKNTSTKARVPAQILHNSAVSQNVLLSTKAHALAATADVNTPLLVLASFVLFLSFIFGSFAFLRNRS